MRKLLLFLFLSPLAFGQVGSGNITASGSTCATTNACVIAALSTSSSSASIAITGTWSATVQFEASPDGGTTYVAINGTPPNSTTAVTSTTGNGVWTFNVGSMTHLRARASALASGTVGVNINASSAPIMASSGSNGGAAVWGAITGTLSSQTDLQNALNLLAPIASPTFTGTATSPVFATSGSNGGISGIEGTGAGLTPAAGADLIYPDSSSHCWHESLNNVDVGCTATASNTMTFTNKTLTSPVINTPNITYTPIATTGLMIPSTFYGNIATPATLVGAQNEMDCLRFIAGTTITATRFRYSPTVSAGVGTHTGFAFYSSDGTTRIMTTGALDGTLTGGQSVTVSSFTLNRDTAYLACWTDDAATSTTWAAFGVTTSNSGYTNLFNGNIKNFVKGTTASVAGAPPTSLSTLTAATTFNTPVTFIEP